MHVRRFLQKRERPGEVTAVLVFLVCNAVYRAVCVTVLLSSGGALNWGPLFMAAVGAVEGCAALGIAYRTRWGWWLAAGYLVFAVAGLSAGTVCSLLSEPDGSFMSSTAAAIAGMVFTVLYAIPLSLLISSRARYVRWLQPADEPALP